jgi:RNA polymerase sigma-70 factor (ECF subfamily)
VREVSSERRAQLRSALRGTAGDLLAYFERRLRSKDDAADLLGETMLQAWRRADALPIGDCSMQRMWLFTIAAHVLANHSRSARRRTALAQRLRLHLDTSDAFVPDSAEVSAVRDAVMRLHESFRELVLLIHWDGFSIVEAAEILDMNASTARGRYAAAKEALKDALQEHAEQTMDAVSAARSTVPAKGN